MNVFNVTIDEFDKIREEKGRFLDARLKSLFPNGVVPNCPWECAYALAIDNIRHSKTDREPDHFFIVDENGFP